MSDAMRCEPTPQTRQTVQRVLLQLENAGRVLPALAPRKTTPRRRRGASVRRSVLLRGALAARRRRARLLQLGHGLRRGALPRLHRLQVLLRLELALHRELGLLARQCGVAPPLRGFGGTLPELLFGLRRAGTELVRFRQGSKEEPAVGELALGVDELVSSLVHAAFGLVDLDIGPAYAHVARHLLVLFLALGLGLDLVRWKLLLGTQSPAFWNGPEYPNGTKPSPISVSCGDGCLYDVVSEYTCR